MTTRAPGWLRRPETLLLAIALSLTAATLLALYTFRVTTLTVAVAPREGSEPALIRAYAEALERGRKEVRLRVLPFDDVQASAEALAAGRADLAVVRPDIALPANALTIAILRDQAVLIAAPEAAGIRALSDLAGRRLGLVAGAPVEADMRLLRTVLAYDGLAVAEAEAPADGGRAVALLRLTADEAEAALREGRVDALVALAAPALPRARALVAAVRAAAGEGGVSLVEVGDDSALAQRFPRLNGLTVPAGLLSGEPRLPAEDLRTLAASYRLVAASGANRTAVADVTQHLFEMRAALAEAVPAADVLRPPTYETTVEATTARLPNHPGAIDYFEREQRGFFDRYGDVIYLLAFMGGGLGSATAWLRQRIARLRRERTDELLDHLLAIREGAQGARDPDTLARLAAEIDGLAAEIVQDARVREVEPRTLSAVALAIDAARSTIAERRRACG